MSNNATPEERAQHAVRLKMADDKWAELVADEHYEDATDIHKWYWTLGFTHGLQAVIASDDCLVPDNARVITAAAYAGDIVSRLRNWRGLHLAHGGALFDEAAAEIERLRGQLAWTERERNSLRVAIQNLADQDATPSVQGVNAPVTMDAAPTDEEWIGGS